MLKGKIIRSENNFTWMSRMNHPSPEATDGTAGLPLYGRFNHEELKNMKKDYSTVRCAMKNISHG